MKKAMAVAMALAASVGALAKSRDVRIYVYDHGAGTDSVRPAALQLAFDAAKVRAGAQCAGAIVSVEEIRRDCYGGRPGVPYTCIVRARAVCEDQIQLH